MKSQFIALHFDHLRLDETHFDEAIRELRSTKYSLSSQDKDLPHMSHCVNAIRYILSRNSWDNLPYAYIGNLIHTLIERSFLWARLIPLEEHARWDLVFFHRRSIAHRAYMISHVGIFVDDNWTYFHSSPRWWKLDNIVDSLQKWTLVSCELAMKRTDPRTKN